MEAGTIEDMLSLFPEDFHWGAILLQEGPHAQTDSYAISANGHAIFSGTCEHWTRSVTILIHHRWVESGVNMNFSSRKKSCLRRSGYGPLQTQIGDGSFSSQRWAGGGIR
eukprot:6089932-Pyramimonas_sp.AAC.1